MQLYRIKNTRQIGFFPSSSRTSYDMSTEPITVYKFLRLVDPSTDWENVKLGRDIIFTGESGRFNLNDLETVYLQDLKKDAKSKKKVNEASEMAKSDLHKIVDYSEKLQSMINPSESTEDWVKAKLTHAADYLDTVFDYLRFYYEKNSIQELLKEAESLEKKYKNSDDVIDAIQYALDVVGLEPSIGSVADATNVVISLLRTALSKEKDEAKKHLLNAAISAVSIIPFGDLAKLIKLRLIRKPAVKLLKFVKKYLKGLSPSYSNRDAENLVEKWSVKYKKSINCNNPKGFSQKNYCKRKARGGAYKNEGIMPIVGTNIKPGGHIYNGLTPKIENELNSTIQRIVNHEQTEQDLDIIKFYLKKILTENPSLRNINLTKPTGYYPNKNPVLDLIHGVVSGIPPKDIKYFIEDLKGSGQNIKNRSKFQTGLGYFSLKDSETINEFYRLAGQILLESENSEMLVGDLKNINAKAKMLMKMIDDSENLEDWVKAKLNLAGEYLDDIFHHIDYFGQKGRQFDEYVDQRIKEGWKDLVAAGALGLAALKGGDLQADKPIKVSTQVKTTKPAITQTVNKDPQVSLLNTKTSDYIGQWEGKRKSVYLDTENKPTIGIGHYLTNRQQDRDLFKSLFGNSVNYDNVLKGKQTLTNDQIERLFNVDVKIKERLANNKINNFSSLPQYVKNAIINAFYRGDIGPKTIKLMNAGKWNLVAKEYLNHENARSGPKQIQLRMKTNAAAFDKFAKNKNEYFGFNYAIG